MIGNIPFKTNRDLIKLRNLCETNKTDISRAIYRDLEPICSAVLKKTRQGFDLRSSIDTVKDSELSGCAQEIEDEFYNDFIKRGMSPEIAKATAKAKTRSFISNCERERKTCDLTNSVDEKYY